MGRFCPSEKGLRTIVFCCVKEEESMSQVKDQNNLRVTPPQVYLATTRSMKHTREDLCGDASPPQKNSLTVEPLRAVSKRPFVTGNVFVSREFKCVT